MNKSVSLLAMLVAGFILGLAATYFYLQPRLAYQGKSVMDWVNSANQNQMEANVYKNQLASTSSQLNFANSQLQTLQNKPTPSPKVEHIDKTPSHPNLSTCKLQGNFYFCPQDNCYYNPNGSPTGTCFVAPPAGQ